MIALSKYIKIKALPSLPFPRKKQLLVVLLDHYICDQLNVKQFWFHHFTSLAIALGAKGQFKKILKPFFKFGCCFWYHTLMFEKNKLNLLIIVCIRVLTNLKNTTPFFAKPSPKICKLSKPPFLGNPPFYIGFSWTLPKKVGFSPKILKFLILNPI